MIYCIGSLKHERVHKVAKQLRDHYGLTVFDDWHASAHDSDRYWTRYERDVRGRNMRGALLGLAAQNQFHFDRRHLDLCSAAVLVMPAGKSAHMELGYAMGRGKPGFVLFESDPDEYDLMYAFSLYSGGNIVYTIQELGEGLKRLEE